MNEGKRLYRFFTVILLISTLGITFWLGKVYKDLSNLTAEVKNIYDQNGFEELAKTKDTKSQEVIDEDDCGTDCEKEISEKIAEAIATLSAQPKITTKVTKETSKQTAYIPLGETYTTTSTSWVDVPASGVYVDLKNDYSDSAKVSWQASLKVAHANGKAYARLYDDTNKIAVDYSEITTENNSDFKLVSSSDLPFWNGRNLYKVQIKSLNSFETTYSGGKIKISY